MVICLERGADLYMAQLMPLPLTVSVKSRLVLPFWYWLTRAVLDKGPLNVCVCVCVFVILAISGILKSHLFKVMNFFTFCPVLCLS